MGCNESKNKDGAEIGCKKPENKDQGVQQRKEGHTLVKDTATENGEDELKTAIKVKMGRGGGGGGGKEEKHVRFEEPTPSKERIIALEETESEDDDDESFHSAEGEINIKKEKGACLFNNIIIN